MHEHVEVCVCESEIMRIFVRRDRHGKSVMIIIESARVLKNELFELKLQLIIV